MKVCHSFFGWLARVAILDDQYSQSLCLDTFDAASFLDRPRHKDHQVCQFYGIDALVDMTLVTASYSQHPSTVLGVGGEKRTSALEQMYQPTFAFHCDRH